MTEERLEEIIKQGGWVWILDKNNCFGLQLSGKFFIKGNFLRSELGTKYAKLNDIFETKDQAEWALKTVTERIERFEPPMWEEIEKKYDFYFYIKDTSYNFHVNKDLRRIEFSKDFIGTIFLFRSKEFTKENYEKACEMVRDLFNGGSNGKNA